MPLKYQQCMYEQAGKRIDKSRAELEEILYIKHELSRKRIGGLKLNHSFQSIVQNFTNYHMFIEFSADMQYMTIINRKPVQDPENVDLGFPQGS